MAKLPTKPKLCFVVGPIGDDESDDRTHADWLLEDIIQPVFEEHFAEFVVKRADTISEPGQINTQIIDALLNADLVVADLSTLNPNAFYEIGIRHTIQKPIIHMHLEGQRLPFDVANFRSIKFSRKRPRDIRAARTALKAAITAIQAEEYEVDNPVTFSRGKVEFEKTATPGDLVVIDELEAIKRRMNELESYAVSTIQRRVATDPTSPKVGRVKVAISFAQGAGDREIEVLVNKVVRTIFPTLVQAFIETERVILNVDAVDASSDNFTRLSKAANDLGLTVTSIMFT
ncbi:hypothetical protein [Mesorhizobium sp. M0701]|uniref:hypothetical protein n=1 Tax=Mesorhizobium sp. M0701 TaxID=2956989 RepID=UPI0033387D0D